MLLLVTWLTAWLTWLKIDEIDSQNVRFSSIGYHHANQLFTQDEETSLRKRRGSVSSRSIKSSEKVSEEGID